MGKLNEEEQPLWIKAIQQVNQHHVKIIWNDDIAVVYRLEKLQMNCPCTQCRNGDAKKSSKSVSARSITSVGNYALRIMFTEGCSQGIYPYSLVRKLPGERM
jgi:DUF971 family protein